MAEEFARFVCLDLGCRVRSVVEVRFVCHIVDRPKLFMISQNESMWASISFYLAVIINLLVVLFYPFGDSIGGKLLESCLLSGYLAAWYEVYKYNM